MGVATAGAAGSGEVGYTGGHTVSPTYREVSTGTTGHAESTEVRYDPKKITYRQLLDVFWHNIDPTVRDQQFCDEGTQYRTANRNVHFGCLVSTG